MVEEGPSQFFLLAFFLSFSSCAPKGPPCWLTGPCIPYEVGEWIIGVGSGSSQADADKILFLTLPCSLVWILN